MRVWFHTCYEPSNETWMSVTDCILVKTGLNYNYLFWLIIVNSQFKNIMVLGGCMYSFKERNCK